MRASDEIATTRGCCHCLAVSGERRLERSALRLQVGITLLVSAAGETVSLRPDLQAHHCTTYTPGWKTACCSFVRSLYTVYCLCNFLLVRLLSTCLQ